MTGPELRSVLASLGLTTGQAARELGVNRRTVGRWLASDQPIREPIVRAIRTLEKQPEAWRLPE